MTQPLNPFPFLHSELIDQALFVFALEVESAGEYEQVNKVFTGCGKVNAAYELTKAINLHRPQLIVNLGSAGSNQFKRGELFAAQIFFSVT
jgi:adenosylhomocysteine nucleosidase